MFFGPGNVFHPRHDTVFLFAYNAKNTIEFTLSWIFFSGKIWTGKFFRNISLPSP